ncbi:MAG: hypothetical protein EP350_02990 [Alphaproteobacteria bacterium]|nr:MAG: hypothetical protein EP350_02990 [Alphaproteobacteria bacterium]
MGELTRRSVLWATIALAVQLGPPLKAQLSERAQVELPDSTMILSRRIERPLSDGQMIVMTRSWEVRFARSGQGIAVEGRQIQVDVDAPAKLSELAQIERNRSTDGLFPILLSSDGEIVGAGMINEESEISRAAEVAAKLIEQSSKSDQEKRTALYYLNALQAAGSSVVEALPADLFYPVPGEKRDLRKISLPDGHVGEIELIRTSQLAPGHEWMGSSQRKVVTKVAGTSQESLETWTMRPQ